MSKTFFKIHIIWGKFLKKTALAKGFKPQDEGTTPTIPEYIRDLYTASDETSNIDEILHTSTNESIEIFDGDLEEAHKRLCRNKATGIDELPDRWLRDNTVWEAIHVKIKNTF